MIWDRGTWTPVDPDVDAALAKGELKFRLDGEKLRGEWVLVRMGKRRGETRNPWLLIKHRDETASKRDIADEEPRSVVTDRLLVEIARDEGGNMEKAADGDPPALLRKMIANPKLVKPSEEVGEESRLALESGASLARDAVTFFSQNSPDPEIDGVEATLWEALEGSRNASRLPEARPAARQQRSPRRLALQ